MKKVIILLAFNFIIIGCKRKNIPKPNETNTISVANKKHSHTIIDSTNIIIRDYKENEKLIIDAISLKNSKNYYQAIQKFNRAEIKYGSRLSIYLNRGVCYYGIKNYEEAIRDYSKCLDLKDDYFAAYINRGLAYMDNKQFKKSLTDFDKSIKLNPDEPAGYLNRSLLNGLMKNYERCCKDARKSIELGFIEKYNDKMPQNLLDKYCN